MAVGKEQFGENNHVEFKAELPQRHEKFLKDILAFANTSGGRTLLGVADDGTIVGIGEQNPFKLADRITNMIADACTPLVHTEINVLTLEGRTVLEIVVFPGRQRPYYLQAAGRESSCYIRVNGTSRPAGEHRLKELEMEGMRLSYDTLPEIGLPFDEGAAFALCAAMRETALKGCRTPEERDTVQPLTLEKLEDFGILRREGRERQPTHAFALLTAPRERFVKIQCALFKGLVRDEFIDRKEFRGPIQEQLEMAFQFVLRHINRGATIAGVFRRDHYELPVQSVREMIANAVLHRSYLDEASIQVSLYDDRLEIDSPGMLYDGLSVAEALSGKSRCRNAAIAEAFQYMKLVEGWGTGLPRLFSRCREMGLPAPSFGEYGDGMRVTIFRKGDLATTQSTTQTTQATQATQATQTTQATQATQAPTNTAKVPETCEDDEVAAMERRIMAIMRQNGKVSQNQIAQALGEKANLIKYHVREMRKKGLITRRGTQQRGDWLVLQGNGKPENG